MEEISVKIREASWLDVINYLETHEKSEVKSDLYYKLAKLYETYCRANKLTHLTWFKNYKTPKIDYQDWDKLHLTVTRYEKFQDEIDILNGTIYNHLLKLDNYIVEYIKKYYALGNAYNQAKSDYIPSMFDKDSIRTGLKKNLSKNMFEDRDVASNVLDTYYYLLELQSILKKVKEVCENELERVKEFYKKDMLKLKVNTSDKATNLLLNGFLLYQALVCRIFGKSSFYQSGGATGFRDQLQDCLGIKYTLL